MVLVLVCSDHDRPFGHRYPPPLLLLPLPSSPLPPPLSPSPPCLALRLPATTTRLLVMTPGPPDSRGPHSTLGPRLPSKLGRPIGTPRGHAVHSSGARTRADSDTDASSRFFGHRRWPYERSLPSPGLCHGPPLPPHHNMVQGSPKDVFSHPDFRHVYARPARHSRPSLSHGLAENETQNRYPRQPLVWPAFPYAHRLSLRFESS